MQEDIDLNMEVRNLLGSRKFAVLSTLEPDHPYPSLVAFAETFDLRAILFATSRATRKYGNITSRSGVALLVDDRSNDPSDILDATAVTIIGNAEEATGSERETLAMIYLEKQPRMKEFLFSPNTALIKVDVEYYIIVRRFQDVSVLKLRS
jgi:heme iron utilization protein